MVSTLDCYMGGLLFTSNILPLLKCTCGEQQLATMLAIKRSAGVAPEMNLGELTSHMSLPCVKKAAHSGVEVHQKKIFKKSSRYCVYKLFLFIQGKHQYA